MGFSSVDRFVENILVNYRWVFVCLFLLPTSFFFEIYSYTRAWLVFKLNTAPQKHDTKVKFVQKQVRQWKENGGKGFMCTARPGWQTMSFRQPLYKKTMTNIDINLVDVLKVDHDKKSVLVEPMVTMGQLTATLAPIGVTIPTLPELDELTVGGLVMGTGIESSSHKYGLFQHICLSYELVLADGSLVKCSKDSNADLFYAVPWSHGTLGFLTAVEIMIIPAQRFVKLEYQAVHSLEDACRLFEKETMKKQNNDFIETLMFSRDEGVVMTGTMTSFCENDKLNAIGKWYKPWFFEHIRTYLKKENGIEYLPLRDYYHRHSRSIFWELQDIVPFGNNFLFRLLLGWLMPVRVSLLKLTQTKTIKRLYENNHFIQDLLVPMSNLQEAISVFHNAVEIYPLWLCPFKLNNDPGMIHSPTDNDTMYVDVGLYGVPKSPNKFHPTKTTRSLEGYLIKTKSYQMLHADTYMTREEFREMFDHKLYDRVRQNLDCTAAFPDVYDKVSKKARF